MNPVGSLIASVLRILAGHVKRFVISGYREFVLAAAPRRALLSYLVLPLLPPPNLRDHTKFSNPGIAQEIPRALNELGYIVDIVNYDNLSWLPSQHYDLFIGHAGVNYEHIAQQLPDEIPKIYFATGIYWQEWNIRLTGRINDLALRTGCLLPSYRAVQHDEEYANRAADGIICLGNARAVETFKDFPHVIGINNAIFPLKWTGWQNKDYDKGRKHFLFFGGRGSILKGLDLMLEVFVQTDLHLHICQHMEPDFVQVFRRELTEHPNIHLYGFVRMRSPEFEALAARCNWIVSATCAEGQPGAVLECMGHGLIPILPDAANIDLEDWGIRLLDCTVETIRAIVIQASEMDVGECKQRARRVLDVTRRVYTVENFRSSFKAAVTETLASVKRGLPE